MWFNNINQYVLDVSRYGRSSGEVNFGSVHGELRLRRMKLKRINQIMEPIIMDQIIMDQIIMDQRPQMLRRVEQQIIILV